MSAAIDYVIRYLQVLRITDIIDIFIVTIIVYLLLNWLNETRGMQLIKGIAILFVVVAVSNLIGLTALNYILSGIFQLGVIAIVVISSNRWDAQKSEGFWILQQTRPIMIT